MEQADWMPFFPYAEPRIQQVDIINKALEAYNAGKKFVIIEAGTGVGKSAIGYTISSYISNNSIPKDGYLAGSYFLTTQKILQEQYVKDFGRLGLKSIKSSANYSCRFYKNNTCAESSRALKTAEKGSSFWNACTFSCNYKNRKKEFLDSASSITNFPYFLAETTYSGKLQPRQVLVTDECHNAETQLSKFIEVAVTEKFAKQFLKLDFPLVKTQLQAFEWIENVYVPKLKSYVKHTEDILSKHHGLKDKLQEFVSLAKRFEILDKHVCKMKRFLKLYDKENWVFNDIQAYGRKSRRFEFKPIDVAPFANDMLFKLGSFNILMSATIIDKDHFCELLGIESGEAEFVSAPSPFPTKNRPIVAVPIGRMRAADIENTLPRLAEAVNSILENHPKDKGIIHCHTFKIANYLKKNIRSRRLMIHNSENREDVLRKHMSSKKASVLLSPSMTEGVDLKEELSRFQIICKVPYPYLGDKLIKKKMHKWKWWYPFQTAKTIIQSAGRSVRSIDDKAVTYILDADWDKFYQKNNRLFPTDFQECLK
jgi:Rad3-related DNA helicase